MALVENRGRLVSKDELMTRIWPGTFIEEATLARNISDLRKALAQGSTNQKFVETVPKHGYRFIAPVRELNLRAEDLVIELHRSSRVVSERAENCVETACNETGRVERSIHPNRPISKGQKKPASVTYLIAVLGTVLMSAASAFFFWKRPWMAGQGSGSKRRARRND